MRSAVTRSGDLSPPDKDNDYGAVAKDAMRATHPVALVRYTSARESGSYEMFLQIPDNLFMHVLVARGALAGCGGTPGNDGRRPEAAGGHAP